MNTNKKTKNVKQNKAIANITEKTADMASSKTTVTDSSTDKGKQHF